MLPDNDFFTPVPAFKDWLLAQHWLRYRRIIDAGAGRGLMSCVLRHLGFDVHAIDLHERPTNIGKVEIADATTFDYESNDVLMIARPCHDGWHIGAMRRAGRYGCLDLLYIGLPRNIERDFGDEWEIELLVENIGSEGECIWRVYGEKAKLTRYSKLDNGAWGKLEERRGEPAFVNDNGGYCIIDPDQIVEHRFKECSWQGAYIDPAAYAKHSERAALAMYETNEGREKGGYGWVGPEGRWYPCGSTDHDKMLYDSFGIDRRRCEELGFVKCYGSFYSREFVYRWNEKTDWNDPRRHPTPAQLKTLREIGFDVRADEQDQAERDVSTLTKEEQTKVAEVMRKPRRDPRTGYRTDRTGD